MSTRSTLVYGDDFHLFKYGFDDGVYLEIGEITVHIEDHVWESIRGAYKADMRLVDMTDAELTEHVRSGVRSRRNEYEDKLKDRMDEGLSEEEAKVRLTLYAFCGCFMWGRVSEPFDKQYEYALEQHIRERKRQREVKAKTVQRQMPWR